MAIDKELDENNIQNNLNIMAISAEAANAAPIATDDEITNAFVGMLRILPEELLANDSDLDGDTVRGVSIQNAVNGTVFWDGTHVVFVAEKGYSGPASFSYTVTDDHGGFDTATVNLTIIPNTTPEAVDDLIKGISNRQIVIAPETLLANDSDIDGDRIEGIAIQDAKNGVLTWDGQYLTFTPDEGYEGPASFTYTITDHNGGEDTATVNIDIKSEASITGRFEAIDNKIFSKVDGTLEIPENFLTDDDKGTDKTILNVHGAKNGTVELVDGVVKFTPDDGYLGPAEFSYTLLGNDGLTDIARVEIEVQAPWEILNEFSKDQISDPEPIEGGYGLSYFIGYNYDIGFLTNLNSYIYNAENTSVEGGDWGYLYLLPQDGFVGIASFDYIKRPSRWNSENQETEYSNWFEMGTARFNVQESSIPLPEGIGDEVVVTSHNGTIKVPLEALVLNDHRGFGTDTVSAESIQSVQSAVNGTVEIIGGNVIFTPAAGYMGEASFSYSITVNGETKDVPVKLTIGESGDTTAMIAKDDFVDLNGKTYDQYVFNKYPLTVNDQHPYYDKYPESIIAVQDATSGTVELATRVSQGFGGGFYFVEEIIYTPNDSGYNGTASFDYVSANTLGSISIATVTFDVTSNKAPEVNNETLFMTRTTAKLKEEWLLQNDVDSESNSIELTGVINPFGVSIDAQYNQFNLKINDAPFNVDAPLFQYKVSDGRLSSTGQVNVVQQADGDFVGTDGTDIMYASNDDNILDGGDGNDFINSGDGDDRITGGLGSDVFFWTLSDAPGDQTNLGNNVITDFNVSEDKLDFKDVFGYLGAFGPNQPTLLEQLDSRMDFTLIDGNTEINLQGTHRGLQEPFVGKITLENVDLFALTGIEGANDLDILQSSFRNNLVGYE